MHESFIVRLPARVASPAAIRFYKCFISFTESDDGFSGRLCNDLKGKGVRCWRWKDHDSYRKAFDRRTRDLKAEA